MRGSIAVQCTMVSIIALTGHGGASRVLLLRRAGAYLNGAWSYVAGHIEAGEAAWQTALRELAEETALTPDALYATSFCERFYLRATNAIEVVPAFVARVDDHAHVRLNGEHSAFRWAAPADAAAVFPFGSQRDLMAYIEREFITREPSAFLLIPRN